MSLGFLRFSRSLRFLRSLGFLRFPETWCAVYSVQVYPK
jgi:hypothetical protein